MDKKEAKKRLAKLYKDHELLINQANKPVKKNYNGIFYRHKNPILTAEHAPIHWRYDLNPKNNPYLMERLGVNAVFNAGAIQLKDKYYLVVRVEGWDRKSFFAIAESPNGIDKWRFWDYPVTMPVNDVNETNVYDMRLTQHEDGWIYGIFCAEGKAPDVPESDKSSVITTAGISRTKDLKNWERLPDLKSPVQQRNVVLHPEFVNEKYALYTCPQEGGVGTSSGKGIGWALIDSMENAEIKGGEKIIDERIYHTIRESKSGQGPAPLKTKKGWLHLAHGVRACAAGLRYVLYMFMTSLEDPTKVIAKPSGYFMAPADEERIGDVSNVLFANGWIKNDNDEVFIYYASSDTRMHVATSTVDQLLDYIMNTPEDGLISFECVQRRNQLISKNLEFLRKKASK